MASLVMASFTSLRYYHHCFQVRGFADFSKWENSYLTAWADYAFSTLRHLDNSLISDH